MSYATETLEIEIARLRKLIRELYATIEWVAPNGEVFCVPTGRIESFKNRILQLEDAIKILLEHGIPEEKKRAMEQEEVEQMLG